MRSASYRPDPRSGTKLIARLAILLALADAPDLSPTHRRYICRRQNPVGRPRTGRPASQQRDRVRPRRKRRLVRPNLQRHSTHPYRRHDRDSRRKRHHWLLRRRWPALGAALNQPALPRFDAQGNLYFSDTGNFRIRRVDSKGLISTIAGSGIFFRPGMDLEGPALSRSLDTVVDAAVDPAGNFYFITNNNLDLIRRITPGGRIVIFPGIPHSDCLSCSDGDNGPASAARIAPGFLAADGKGNLFLSEFTNAPTNNSVTHICRISPDGTITRFAGYGVIPTSNTVDDEAKPALDIFILKIGGMSADTAGNLYFVQTPATNSRTGLRIRRIDPSGVVNTIAGGPPFSSFVRWPAPSNRDPPRHHCGRLTRQCRIYREPAIPRRHRYGARSHRAIHPDHARRRHS